MISTQRIAAVCTSIMLSALCTWSQTTAIAPPVAPSDPAGVRSSQDDKYRIGYRDKLSIQVFRHPDLNKTVAVEPNGTISLFRLHEPIVAVCKTEKELEREIAAAYQKDYLKNPEVSVTATEQMSQAFAVIGAVPKPGHYYINRRVRLLELLAFAGGPTKDAGSRVLVARTGSTSGCGDSDVANTDVAYLDFKIKDIQEGKQSLEMKPGDIVSVMESDVVFVYGNVLEQGQVVMKQPITLMQAIASAKGLKPATKKDSVRIIRQKPGSAEPEVISYDLNAINKQKMADPFLQPNDIVAISEDGTKSILLNLKGVMTQGIPSLFYRIP